MRIRIKPEHQKKAQVIQAQVQNVKKSKYFTKTMYTENQVLKIICLTATDMEMMV